MCLILNGKAGDLLKIRQSSDWGRVWRSNSDGAAMLILGDKPTLLRTMDHAHWNDKTASLLNGADPETEVLIHWRMATHGLKTLHNVHPFRIDKEGSLLLFHNGVVCGFGSDRDSDTHDLAKVLRTVTKLKDKLKILDSLSRYNRFAVADLKSRSVMLLGDFEEHKNVYHSNRQIIPIVQRVIPGSRSDWVHSWILPD